MDNTLVIALGEFGRTPKVNKDAGRDHWPFAMSVLMAGAGIPGGQIVGATDQRRDITPRGMSTVPRRRLRGVALHEDEHRPGTGPHDQRKPADPPRERRPPDQGTLRLTACSRCVSRASHSPASPPSPVRRSARWPSFPVAGTQGTTVSVTAAGKFDPWPPRVWVDALAAHFSCEDRGEIRRRDRQGCRARPASGSPLQ